MSSNLYDLFYIVCDTIHVSTLKSFHFIKGSLGFVLPWLFVVILSFFLEDNDP